jgi:hypothetical protein
VNDAAAALQSKKEILRAGYEDLRQSVLASGGGADRSFGLVLFVREGMTAWMKACAEAVSVVETSGRLTAGAAPMSGDLRVEATRIMVTMALEGHWGVAG